MYGDAARLISDGEFRDSVARMLERVGVAAGWPFGEGWLATTEGTLQRGPAWFVDPALAGFDRAAERSSLPHADGSPAVDPRVLSADRAALAEQAGLHESITIPVRSSSSSGVVGLLVFYVQKGAPTDIASTAFVELAASLLGEIARRRELEIALEEQNAALRKSNADLDSYASVASHDLQEPLRKIVAFGDRLAKKHGEALGEEGRHYLDRIVDSSKRLRNLITDILDYSRLGQSQAAFDDVDLGGLVREIVAELEAAPGDRVPSVHVGDLPHVFADRQQMRQLFENLLSNAMKFGRASSPVNIRIEASASEREGFTAIRVIDDGIGFEQKHADRIFRMFERLNGIETFPGTGIGLAVCRRIAEKHGGFVDARGVPGEGAVFTVTLPRQSTRASSSNGTHDRTPHSARR